MEIYKDRLIAYSMGNFATFGRFNLSGAQGIGEILEVSVADDGSFTAGRIFGTVQVENGRPVPDPKNQAADLVRVLTAADFPEHGVRIALDGTFGR
jgi:poly-gamma-glutamate capsule biosynthesis protein CapA/YwtB (metallophosphatase superfamily)